MDSLTAELYKTRKIPLVAKAYCTSNLKSVVVELRTNSSIGLVKPTLLSFSTGHFVADQVNAAIVNTIAASVLGSQ